MPRLDCLEEPGPLARRRPGVEPGLRKAVRALLHGEHYTRVADYDSFADDCDVWVSDMTEDVGSVVELARGADKPVVEVYVARKS